MKYIAALTAMLLAACPSVHHSPEDEALIAESVLRSLYGNNASAHIPNKLGASLCIDGKDPSPEFVNRFSGMHPPPLACSAAAYSEERGEIVKRGTDDPAITFTVGDIEINSPNTATAVGAYYEASLSAAEYTFKLVRVGGKWVVQEQKMNWIS